MRIPYWATTSFLVVTLASAVVVLGQSQSAPAASLVGVRQGASQERTGSGAWTVGERLPSLMIMTRGGYYSTIATDADVPTGARKPLPPLKTPGKPTDAEKIALADLVSSVIAHAGRYEVKGNVMSRIRMVDMTAGTNTTSFEYRIEDGGKTLKLISKGVNGETVRTYRRLE